jgi:hypothetical protein
MKVETLLWSERYGLVFLLNSRTQCVPIQTEILAHVVTHIFLPKLD